MPDNRSHEGINELVSIFQIPLGIVALLIPVLAVYAANHRSEQSREIIRLTQIQNFFTNYYKHLEEFCNYCEKGSVFPGVKIDYRGLHNKLYPNALTSGIKLHVGFVFQVEFCSKSIVDALWSESSEDRANPAPDEITTATFDSRDGQVWRNIAELLSWVEPYIIVAKHGLRNPNWNVSQHPLFELISHRDRPQVEAAYIALICFSHAVRFDTQFSSSLSGDVSKIGEVIDLNGSGWTIS